MDAITEVINVCHGAKQVSALLWPDKNPRAAHRFLLDCLNLKRSARLDPDRLRMVLRLGRDAGCHAAINWLLRDVGYEDSRPLEPQDEQAALMRDYIAAAKMMQSIASRIERRAA